jgi:hypothetical protein
VKQPSCFQRWQREQRSSGQLYGTVFKADTVTRCAMRNRIRRKLIRKFLRLSQRDSAPLESVDNLFFRAGSQRMHVADGVLSRGHGSPPCDRSACTVFENGSAQSALYSQLAELRAGIDRGKCEIQ